MSKMMTLEVLSSIKGAQSSKAVNSLFEVIKNAQPYNANNNPSNNVNDYVNLESLREDVVMECPESEKELIRANFPIRKDNYLVVSKVMED